MAQGNRDTLQSSSFLKTLDTKLMGNLVFLLVYLRLAVTSAQTVSGLSEVKGSTAGLQAFLPSGRPTALPPNLQLGSGAGIAPR